MPRYRALVGLSYADRRLEPGDTADDLPEQSLKWLLRDGCIEEVTDSPKKPVKEGADGELLVG